MSSTQISPLEELTCLCGHSSARDHSGLQDRYSKGMFPGGMKELLYFFITWPTQIRQVSERMKLILDSTSPVELGLSNSLSYFPLLQKPL